MKRVIVTRNLHKDDHGWDQLMEFSPKTGRMRVVKLNEPVSLSEDTIAAIRAMRTTVYSRNFTKGPAQQYAGRSVRLYLVRAVKPDRRQVVRRRERSRIEAKG